MSKSFENLNNVTDMFHQSLIKGVKVLHMRGEGSKVGLPQVVVLGKSPMLKDKGTQSQKLQVEGQRKKPGGQAGWLWEIWSLGQMHIWRPGRPVNSIEKVALICQEEKWFDNVSSVLVSYRTLSLYSALMMLQLRMEGSASCGMLMTLVTFWLVDAGMGSPTSLMRSLVCTSRLPSAKKLCFRYTVYLGLISRDELFTMWARTFNPSPVWKRPTMVKTFLTELISIETTCKALTLKEPSFLQIDVHGYSSWV